MGFWRIRRRVGPNRHSNGRRRQRKDGRNRIDVIGPKVIKAVTVVHKTGQKAEARDDRVSASKTNPSTRYTEVDAENLEGPS